MRILLVSPGTSDDLDTRIIREVTYLRARALFGPHAIVTVAALTPAGHEVVVHDEHLRGPVDSLLDAERFDVVGVNLTTNQFNRAQAIARAAKHSRPRAITVAGGIGAPLLLHQKGHAFDVVFHGEAEETWPQFVADAAAGNPGRVYQRYARPDLSAAPAPAWDLIARDIPSYGTLSVQTTRGCPHDCAFCDVIYTYGRRPRSKTVAQVITEIRLLERLGAGMIFVADDNFGGGNRPYAKELLREMVRLNNSFAQPLVFMTQVDILVAQDPELLALMADANFADLMIGIESVNESALRDMNKLQNLRIDPLEAVRTIQSYGIAVLGHMIVGNDSDDAAAFAQTEDFVNRAAILHHFCHPLMAPPGTRLWHQYAREGRLVKLSGAMADRLDIVPNTVPRRMTRVALMEGLADYWERVNSPKHYLARALAFLAGVTRRPNTRRPSPRALPKVFRLLRDCLVYYVFRAPREHRRAFFAFLRAAARKGPWLPPRAIFLYTCFLMDHMRARHDAAVAREQAAWERDHPGELLPEETGAALAPAVHEHAEEIARAAYDALHPRIGAGEPLYRAAVESIIEYSDRFGPGLHVFDEIEQGRLRDICERVPQAGAPAAAPGDRPPPGFARDILDAVDRALRVRAGGAPART